MCTTVDGKKFSSGGRNKNRQPWTAGSSTIWSRRQIQFEVDWGLNCSSEEGGMSLKGAEDAQVEDVNITLDVLANVKRKPRPWYS
jgi:hypothetical protein